MSRKRRRLEPSEFTFAEESIEEEIEEPIEIELKEEGVPSERKTRRKRRKRPRKRRKLGIKSKLRRSVVAKRRQLFLRARASIKAHNRLSRDLRSLTGRHARSYKITRITDGRFK